MPINKQIKGVAGLLAILSISTAIGITEWRSGHPIGSFAESFIAVALLLSSFIVAVVVGVKTKNRLDSSRNLYRDGARMVGGYDLPPKSRAPPSRSVNYPVRMASSNESFPERTTPRSVVSPKGERRERKTDQCELCLTAGQPDD